MASLRVRSIRICLTATRTEVADVVAAGAEGRNLAEARLTASRPKAADNPLKADSHGSIVTAIASRISTAKVADKDKAAGSVASVVAEVAVDGNRSSVRWTTAIARRTK